MIKRIGAISGRIFVTGICAALMLAIVGIQPSTAKDPFDKLVAMAKAEMDKKGGKIRMSLDWPARARHPPP